MSNIEYKLFGNSNSSSHVGPEILKLLFLFFVFMSFNIRCKFMWSFQIELVTQMQYLSE